MNWYNDPIMERRERSEFASVARMVRRDLWSVVESVIELWRKLV